MQTYHQINPAYPNQGPSREAADGVIEDAAGRAWLGQFHPAGDTTGTVIALDDGTGNTIPAPAGWQQRIVASFQG